MPTPLDRRFPDGKRTKVWRATKVVFRRSDLLSKVKTWVLSEGDDEPDSLTRFPRRDECPWVRATPERCPVSRKTETSNATTLTFRVEYAVEGGNIENLMNLAEAIEDSFARNAPSPTTDVNVFTFLRTAGGAEGGVYEPQVDLIDLTPKQVDGVLIGTGRITMNMLKYS